MIEWKEYKLGEIYDFSSGLSKAREFFGKGFGFVSFKDVFYNYFLPDQLTEMVMSTPKEQISCSVKRGDVFLTRTSETMEDLGMSTVALKNYPSATFNGFTKRLRPKDPYLISPTFAGYYFRSPLFRATVTSYAIMTTRASLNNEILSRLTISLPPIEIQDSIGEVLKSLDDKIELNNSINKELEELAQTLFKQWFIDFEFPNKNGEPYMSSDKIILESKLDMIPEGWDFIQIADVLDFISGYPFKGGSFSKNGNYGIVTIKNVQDGKFVQETDNFIDELPQKISHNAILSVGDILMSLTGNVGRVCYVTKENCLLNQRVVKFNGLQKNSNAFWYYFFRQKSVKDLLISISKGTAQLNLSPIETKSLKFLLPKKIDENIFSVFNEIFNQEIACSIENNELINLRNTLLPKLISGELEINENNN
jgi:type I restriction enzyme S subunit